MVRVRQHRRRVEGGTTSVGEHERYVAKPEERYNGWTNWDTWNTMLLLENTEHTQRWLYAWHENFKRKQKRGVFDYALAESVVEKYLIPVARGKGQAKRFPDFVGDPEINPTKVNKREIVEHILNMDG